MTPIECLFLLAFTNEAELSKTQRVSLAFSCFAKLVYYLEQDLMHVDTVQYWASQLPKTSHFLIFLGFLKSFFHPIFGE